MSSTAALVLLTVGPALYLVGALAAAVLSARPAVARIAAASAALVAASSGIAIAVAVLLGGPSYAAALGGPLPGLNLGLRMDGLSAWFVLLLSSVAFPVVLAGVAYARAYDRHGGPRLAAATNLFLAAMLLVLLADGIYGFLLGWEVMALASYVLVVHEHATAGVRRAGFVYLGMTHIGAASYWPVCSCCAPPAAAGTSAALRQAALEPPVRDLVFILALVGFATKAGVIPLHVWLPRAHPVAPSHVSALMSGVMLKVGIYGLVRICLGPPGWRAGLVGRPGARPRPALGGPGRAVCADGARPEAPAGLPQRRERRHRADRRRHGPDPRRAWTARCSGSGAGRGSVPRAQPRAVQGAAVPGRGRRAAGDWYARPGAAGRSRARACPRPPSFF